MYVDVQLEDEWETKIFLNITYICVDMAKQAGWVRLGQLGLRVKRVIFKRVNQVAG